MIQVRKTIPQVLVHHLNPQQYLNNTKDISSDHNHYQLIKNGYRRDIRFYSTQLPSLIAPLISNQKKQNLSAQMKKIVMEDLIRKFVIMLYQNNYTVQKSKICSASEIQSKGTESQYSQQNSSISQSIQIIYDKLFLYQQYQLQEKHQDQIQFCNNMINTQLQNMRRFSKKKKKIIEKQAQSNEDIQIVWRFNLELQLQNFLQKVLSNYYTSDKLQKTDSQSQQEQQDEQDQEVQGMSQQQKQKRKQQIQQSKKQYYIQLYKMMILVHRNLFRIHNAKCWNFLMFTPPNSPYLSKIIHPLSLGIKSFLQYSKNNQHNKNQIQNNAQPKIVFINLDGKQSHQNIRSIKQNNSNLYYISIYKDPSQVQLQQSKIPIQKISKLVEFQSQIIIREAYSKQHDAISKNILNKIHQKEVPNQSKPKIHLFPMNSRFLQQQYKRKTMYQIKPQLKNFPTLQSSEDIFFLFQKILFEEIRSFNPTTIIISYNGYLDIEQSHFSEIIRNLSIISDHRIVLFPNLSELFKDPSEYLIKKEDQMKQQNAQQEEEDQSQQFSLKDIFKYYKQKMPYFIAGCYSTDRINNKSLNIINQQRFFHNLSMFIKISSGHYSMENRIIPSSLGKYKMGYRYMYLQRLSSFIQFQHIQKKSLRKWQSNSLQKLYQNYAKQELKQNRKDNESYQKLIDKVINQICKKIEQGQILNSYSKEIGYRILYIEEQLKRRNNDDEQIQQNSVLKYLQQKKKFLLLQNLQTYKTKKHFIYSSNTLKNDMVRCFKFCPKDQQDQQLQFQKYTQILINDKANQKNQNIVLIVNYKNYKDQNIMLTGSKNNLLYSQDSIIHVVQVKDKHQVKILEKQISKHGITDEDNNYVSNLTRNDIVHLNFSHIFLKNSILLYWPQQWSIQQQVKCKLLGLTYKPKTVNKCFRVNLPKNKGEDPYFQQLQNVLDQQHSIDIIPRIGTLANLVENNKIVIFGGIFDTSQDFFTVSSGINILDFSPQDRTFCIKSVKRQHKTKKSNKHNIIKPKMNYIYQNSLLKSGYGRQTTNFYNLFSIQNIRIFQGFQFHKVYLNGQGKIPITLDKPIQINKIGRFPVLNNDDNIKEFQKKFSDLPKDKFVFSKNKQQQLEVTSFLDENYRFNCFKKDHKKLYLFGFNKTVRQKIYLKFWSPQLYVVQGIRPAIVHLLIKTEKVQNSLTMKNFILPRQEDIISVCLEQDSLFLIAPNPSIIPIQSSGSNSGPQGHIYRLNHVNLYEGSLSNMAQISRKGEINMTIQYEFKRQNADDLKTKTLFCIEQKVLLLGGISHKRDNKYIRQDYILEKQKNKFKIKSRKLQCLNASLSLPSPLIVKAGIERYLMYSVVQEYSQFQMSQKQSQSSKWVLKIQTFTEDILQSQRLRAGQIQIYKKNPFKDLSNAPIRIQPNFNQPKVVKISLYQRFKVHKLKEINEKVIIRINKKVQLDEYFKSDLDKLLQIRNVSEEIIKNNPSDLIFFYKQLLQKIKNNNKSQQQIDLQRQDLIRDLNLCYNLINKLILQGILCTQQAPEQEQYRFIIQDKLSKKIKYMAIGVLGKTDLKFFKIRFKQQFLLCLNQSFDEGFFYHPSYEASDEIDSKQKFYKLQMDVEYEKMQAQNEKESQIVVNSKYQKE